MNKYEVVKESLVAIEKELSAMSKRLIDGEEYRENDAMAWVANDITVACGWLRYGVRTLETKAEAETEALND